MEKPIIAIMYDFDKTLSTTDMQNYAFIPKLGLTPEEFWGKTAVFSAKHGVEKILSYMYTMIDECRKKNIPLTEKMLNDCGKSIVLNPGVETWFKRINEYGASKGITIEHYLVSSGTLEIVKGCPIYKDFTKAYACEFVYDEKGNAIWPKQSINFTQKTQFYFKIAKGIDDPNDDIRINEKQAILRVPFSNFIYIGDGITDIACMTLVKKNGGVSIAVFPEEGQNALAHKIKNDGRVNYALKANYTSGSAIEEAVKLKIDKVKLKYDTITFEEEN